MRQISKNFFDSQNVYIGIDVHLAHWNVCIIHGGITRKPFQQPPSAQALYRYLIVHYPGLKYFSAYEAGFCGCTAHYELKALGIENIIFNAADVSQTNKEKRRKTDSIDAAKIARSLAHGDLTCIHIPSQTRLADRNLIRVRACQVADIKRKKIRLRHLMHTNGIRIPAEYANRWPLAFFKWILAKASELNNTTGESLEIMCKNLMRILEEHKKLNRRLLNLMQTDLYRHDYNLLLTVPGIGRVTAITLLLECGDLADFKSAEAFCSFVGLVPDADQSGTHNGKCGITRRRHKTLRYMLTECAWRAIRTDAHLSSLYVKYCRRMPRAKAIVKIANKLAKLIKFVLKNKKVYAPPQ